MSDPSGIALFSKTDLGRLLELIIAQLTHSDGGSIFICKGEELRFFAVNGNKDLQEICGCL
ncbi:MAG: hypothetical protein ACUVRV_01585 [Cyanobacteriota bacterium]